MASLKDFDFSKICFDTDSMQIVSVSRKSNNLELPLTRGPVNFSVMRSDGKFSNRWGVDIGGQGDAYVYCRDNPNGEKVSLHVSGRQHISIRSEVAKNAGVESRFGNVWNEPEFDTSAIATFTLVFPPWGVGLDLADRLKKIKKDELLIVGHNELLVVVAFFIVESGRKMQGKVPHIVLARLPLNEGKTLHVIAWKEPQGDLIDRIRSVFPQASQTLARIGVDDGEYTLCVQGYRQPNSAYMVVVPVQYASPESEDIIKETSERRREAMEALANR